MSGAEDLWAILAADMVPSEVARIPARALEVVGAKLGQVGEERAGVRDSQYRRGYVEGRHDLLRELAEIIKREMTPAVEWHKRLTGEGGRG